jgi:hypothetical protein
MEGVDVTLTTYFAGTFHQYTEKKREEGSLTVHIVVFNVK